MSESISKIKSHIEHIKGEFYWLKQDPSKELKLAVKQAENTLDELENHNLEQIKKILE